MSPADYPSELTERLNREAHRCLAVAVVASEMLAAEMIDEAVRLRQRSSRRVASRTVVAGPLGSSFSTI